VGENTTMKQSISRKMSLVIGARRHLEWGHEKYIMDTIQNHPAQVVILSVSSYFVDNLLFFRMT
jgi:nuclear pore complex protein Nup93